MLSGKRATFYLTLVNKRLDCIATGIVCFTVCLRGGDACVFGDSTRTRTCYTFFPITRELRVILDTRAVVREIKRWPRVGVFPAKTLTCSWLFASPVENEPPEIHVMERLRKCEIYPKEIPARYDKRPLVAVLYSRSIFPFP